MNRGVLLVRKALPSDIVKIQKITKEAFEVYALSAGINGVLPALHETCDDIKKDLETKECYVAEIDDVVVGSVRIEIKDDKTAYLSRFGVGTVYQSQGIGRMLMDYIDEEMVKKDVSKIYLHTASKILSLVRFYYGRGYYIDSTTKDRGYIRALFCKDYTEGCYAENSIYGTFAV